jgi:uncharacterized membrane protein
MEIGPLQLLVVGFENPALDGSIVDALANASEAGLIRVVDLLGVFKDAEGNVTAAEVSELTKDERITYGAWVGALLGLGLGGEEGAEMGAVLGAMHAADEYEYGLDDEGLATIADDIPAGGAAMVLVVDHQWAIPFRNAVRAQGGIFITQDFLNPEALIALGAVIGSEE